MTAGEDAVALLLVADKCRAMEEFKPVILLCRVRQFGADRVPDGGPWQISSDPAVPRLLAVRSCVADEGLGAYFGYVVDGQV